MRAPDLVTLLWTHWQPVWGIDVIGAGWGFGYLILAAQVRNWAVSRTVSFLAGIAVVLVALQSGIDAFDDQLLSDHMVQHLLLLELAPLLVLGGRPGVLLLRGAPRASRARIARVLRGLRPATHPLSCLAVLYIVVVFTHSPSFYDAALRHPGLHDLEHALFLSAGLFMWWPLLDGDPVPGHRLDGLGRLAYAIAAMLPMTLLGAYLDRHPTVVYPAYGPPAHSLGVSAVVDQQQAGAIMWVLGSTLMVTAGLWQAMAALRAEERRLEARERRVAR